MVSKMDQVASGLKASASLAKSSKDMISSLSNLPDKNTDWIETYAGLRKNVGFEKNPRNKWAAVTDGVLRGLELGARHKKNATMEAREQEIQNILGTVQEYNRYAQQTLQWQAKQDAISEKVSGFVNPMYVALMQGQVPRSQLDDLGQTAFRALQNDNVIPKGFVYETVDPQTFSMSYIDKEKGERQFMDLNRFISQEARDTVQQNFEQMGLHVSQQTAQARMMSADASMMNAQTNREFRPQELDVSKQSAQFKNELSSSKLDLAKEKLANQQEKDKYQRLVKSNKEIYMPIFETDKLLTSIGTIQKIVKAKPDLFGTAAASVLANNFNKPSYAQAAAIALKYTGKEKEIFGLALKELNVLVNSSINSSQARQNMFLEALAASASPSAANGPKAIMHMTDVVKEEALRKKNHLMKLADEVAPELMEGNNQDKKVAPEMMNEGPQIDTQGLNNAPVQVAPLQQDAAPSPELQSDEILVKDPMTGQMRRARRKT